MNLYLESVDNGGPVRHLALKADAPLTGESGRPLLGGATMIRGTALVQETWPQDLYRPASSRAPGTPVKFTVIPYYANANRQPAEMTVWLPLTAAKPNR